MTSQIALKENANILRENLPFSFSYLLTRDCDFRKKTCNGFKSVFQLHWDVGHKNADSMPFRKTPDAFISFFNRFYRHPWLGGKSCFSLIHLV